MLFGLLVWRERERERTAIPVELKIIRKDQLVDQLQNNIKCKGKNIIVNRFQKTKRMFEM